MKLAWLCRIKHVWRYENRSFDDAAVWTETGDIDHPMTVGYQGMVLRECRNCGKQQYAYAANWYQWQEADR